MQLEAHDQINCEANQKGFLSIRNYSLNIFYEICPVGSHLSLICLASIENQPRKE